MLLPAIVVVLFINQFHCWEVALNDTKPLIWSCLSINFRFSGRFSKPTKTINNYSFCWPSGLGNYFVCKKFTVHSNPPVVTGICDPNTVSLNKLNLTKFTSLSIIKNILQ